MSVAESLDVISDTNIIVENITIFKKAVEEGAPVQMVASKESVKWRKLGLLYYSRSKQKYYTTQYSERLVRNMLTKRGPI
jgi:hypothetical protein